MARLAPKHRARNRPKRIGTAIRAVPIFDAGADLFPAGPGRNAFENEQAGVANLLADTRMGQIARRTNAGPMLFIEMTGRLRFGISFTQGDRRPGVALDRNATELRPIGTSVHAAADLADERRLVERGRLPAQRKREAVIAEPENNP